MSKRKISPNILFLIDWVKEAVEFLIICNIPYLLINLYDSAVLAFRYPFYNTYTIIYLKIVFLFIKNKYLYYNSIKILKIIKTILVSSHQLRKVEYLLGPKALTAFW